MFLKPTAQLLIIFRLFILIRLAASQEHFINPSRNDDASKGNLSRIRQIFTSPVFSTSLARINTTRFLPLKKDLLKCLQKPKSLLCDEVDNYPWKEVRRILSSRKLQLEFFTNDSLSITNAKAIPANPGNGNQFCESVSVHHFPKVALNKNLELRYIIQGDAQSFLNGIWVEACSSGAICALKSYLPPGLNFNCVQKYMIKKLYAVDPKTGNPYIDSFLIPSCCMCMFSSDESELDNI